MLWIMELFRRAELSMVSFMSEIVVFCIFASWLVFLRSVY